MAESSFDSFLKEYWADRDRGAVRHVSEYAARYPEHADRVREECAALASMPATGSAPRIGPFRLLRELGRGGQGVVHLAVDERLGREVALKVLPPLAPEGAEMIRSRFERESRVTSRLDHPGICTVYEAGQDGGLAWIAMRHVPGRPLADHLARVRDVAGDRRLERLGALLPDGSGNSTTERSQQPHRSACERVLALTERIADALDSAHGAGVVHRDVKPGNVMIEPSGNPVLLDFGLSHDGATDLPSLTRTGEAFGTPDYMSPEQVVGARHELDGRSDVFSLGVMLYECLTGTRPFTRPTTAGTLAAIRNEEPTAPSKLVRSLPRDLDVVLEAALQKRPADRLASCALFAEELRRIREHEPIVSRAISPLVRTARWARRNPKLAASLAATAGSLVVGLLATLLLLRETRLEQDQTRRVTDGLLATELLAEAAEDLFPIQSENVPAMSRWLERSQQLLDREEEHRKWLAAKPERGASQVNAWTRLRVAEHLARLAELRGAMALVESRRETAERLEADTVDAHAEAWTRTLDAIRADSRFSGCTVRATPGLVPLGPDPHSQLQEFALVVTGSPPIRDPRSGNLVLSAKSAVVLVLLPGGDATLGAQSEDPAAPRYLVRAQQQCQPVHEVQLEPYFMGKHEVTEAQFARVRAWSPWIEDHRTPYDEGLLPAAEVSWKDAWDFARRTGATLPTEAQWEHACRAGSDSRFWCGDSPNSLDGCANVRDQTADREMFGTSSPDGLLDDGFAERSPVGSLRPNPLGLHDMHGNLGEWMLDPFLSYDRPVELGSGLRLAGDQRTVQHVVRGGGWEQYPAYCGAEYRSGDRFDKRYMGYGLRLAMRLSRD